MDVPVATIALNQAVAAQQAALTAHTEGIQVLLAKQTAAGVIWDDNLRRQDEEIK